jgi:hypothetical protein
MLEYRTRTSPRGPGYDANVADTGLALWHVQQNINHQPNLVPRIDAGLLSAQNLWRFCDKCKGLHFISNEDTPSYGRCPAGENHVATSSPGYPAGIVVDYQIVMNNANAPGQHDWRWCSKCQGVFYGPNQASSRCPAIGAHDGSASGNYSFVLNDPIAPGQQNWRWCQKCQGLFYGPNQGTSKCPADGFRHDGSMSANYAMLQAGSNSVVWAEWTGGWSWSPPRYGRGANQLWDAGTITPYLRWVDGSSSCTKIHVHPFNIGDGAITVEWVDEACTWVDFNYFGIFEFGLFEYPYNTLAEGLNAVSWGGTLRIKPGTTPETAHISKAMKIDAYGGTATLGR